LQRDENVSVTASGGKGRVAEPSFHLGASRDDGRGLIEAHTIVGRLDSLELDLF